MRKTSIIGHMSMYGMVWGSVIGGIAFAISVLVAGGLGYSLEFAIVGIIIGLIVGGMTGLLAGIFTSLYFVPARNPRQYKALMGIHFALFLCFGVFLLSWVHFFAPGEQLTDPLWDFIWIIIVPSLLAGMMAIPTSQRLAIWYLVKANNR